MPQVLTTFSSALKDDYVGEIRRNVNDGSGYFSKKLMEKVENIDGGGKKFEISVHFGRNNGVGFIPESGDLPAAGQQGYKSATGTVNQLAGRLQISEAVISASKSNATSFTRAADSEVKRLTKDLQNVRHRSTFGNGTGAFATFAANTATNDLTVNNIGMFETGQIIDIYTLPSTSVAAARTVTNVNWETKKITVSGAAVTTAAGDVAVFKGSLGLAYMGLGGIISDNTILQDINPTTDSWWKANILGNAGVGRQLSLEMIRSMVDRVDQVSGKSVEWLSCSFGVRAAYEALLTKDKRFIKPMELEGGYKAIEYDSMPMIVDRYHDKGTIMCGNWDDLGWYQTRELSFMDGDGSVFSRVPNKAAYEATALEFGTMVCFARNAFGALKDLNEPTGY